MKAYVITLTGHAYSEACAARCIQSAAHIGGVMVERFEAIDQARASHALKTRGLTWTWAHGNTTPRRCPTTGLWQHPYAGANLLAKIGCTLSHLLLWERCIELNEPLLILEHDAVFVRTFPVFDFRGICQINDPRGATRAGSWWSDLMIKRATVGVHAKTIVFDEHIPDGLAGNSAYVINPRSAQQLVATIERLGV
jgi:GR25 family glycosyltransferase involved in LPS biosynthesis